MEAFKVSNLTFRYPETGEDVLKNVSFSVKSGEFITLCGPSGCGKSTTVNLIERLYDPVGGEVFIDDVDIKNMIYLI